MFAIRREPGHIDRACLHVALTGSMSQTDRRNSDALEGGWRRAFRQRPCVVIDGDIYRTAKGFFQPGRRTTTTGEIIYDKPGHTAPISGGPARRMASGVPVEFFHLVEVFCDLVGKSGYVMDFAATHAFMIFRQIGGEETGAINFVGV